ncbi:hypothetical protein D3C81_1415650 [compost metagenome]
MQRHKPPQARHQPRRGHGRHRTHRQHAIVPRRERPEGRVDRIQMRADLVEQPSPFRGERNATRLPQQQRIAQPLLQLPHLVAERADGDVHRLGRTRQIAQSRGNDESLQELERWLGHCAFSFAQGLVEEHSLLLATAWPYRELHSSGSTDMRIFSDLLFLHGHITNVELARELAGVKTVAAEADLEGREAAGEALHRVPVSAARSEVAGEPVACADR